MPKREPERSPVVCGAIGTYDRQAVGRVAAALGPELAVAHRDPEAILYLDREGSRWEGADGTWGVTWRESVAAPGPAPADWRTAARGGACGLFADGRRRGVHASASGFLPLYWMRAERALYFASTVHALARGGLGPLTADWDAWAAILTLSYPLEGRTPFSEIRRFAPMSAGLSGPGDRVELLAGHLHWSEAEELTPEEGAARIVAGLRAQAEALEPYGPIALPLTGGWDSRLIACALAERDLIGCAYTVNNDQGDTLDEDLAAAVAARMGIDHVVVEPEPAPFGVELRRAISEVDHQSMPHLQMFRLDAGMPAGGACADGLAGDILIKGLLLTPEVVDEPDGVAAAAIVFDRMVPRRAMLWADETWRVLRHRTRSAFLAEAARFGDHRSAVSLALYSTRTLRGIASSPAVALGRRRDLLLPFLHEPLAASALAVAPGEKLEGRFYRRVLRLIRPEIAELPSTNDRSVSRTRRSRPLHRRREARDAHLDLLEASPLRPWFSPRLESLAGRRRFGRVDGVPGRLLRAQMIGSFGLWCERYRDLIGEPDPAPLFAG